MNSTFLKSQTCLQSLKENNEKQQKKLNEFTLEMNEIYEKLQSKQGVVLGSTHKYWIKLDKNILFIITCFLPIKDVVKLRLVNSYFRYSIELVYPEYLKKYQAIASELQKVTEQKIEITQEAGVIIEQAKQAVSTLNKAAIVECRCLGSPPEAVQETFLVVHIVLCGKQKTEPTWKSAQALMQNPIQFIESVLNLDICSLQENQLKSISELCGKYTIEQMQQKSIAGAQFFRYLLAIHQYFQIPIIQQQIEQQKAIQKLKVIQKKINYLTKFQ